MPLVLATFNVKDFFDPADPAKLDSLAAKLRDMDADILGLQEVGSEAVLRELCARLPDGGGYSAPLVGTADRRGIRNAILSRRPVIAWRVHTSDKLRRGVVQAEIDGGELRSIHTFVMHLKSNRPTPDGELPSSLLRAAEATIVRRIVDDLLEDNLERHVVVMGDLNDAIDSAAVKIVCGQGQAALRPAAEKIPLGERFSNYHLGIRCQIDHLLLSPSLWPHLHGARFLNADLRDHATIPDDQATADSDHAPLVVTLA